SIGSHRPTSYDVDQRDPFALPANPRSPPTSCSFRLTRHPSSFSLPLFLGGALAQVKRLQEPGVVAAAAVPDLARQLDQTPPVGVIAFRVAQHDLNGYGRADLTGVQARPEHKHARLESSQPGR